MMIEIDRQNGIKYTVINLADGGRCWTIDLEMNGPAHRRAPWRWAVKLDGVCIPGLSGFSFHRPSAEDAAMAAIRSYPGVAPKARPNVVEFDTGDILMSKWFDVPGQSTRRVITGMSTHDACIEGSKPHLGWVLQVCGKFEVDGTHYWQGSIHSGNTQNPALHTGRHKTGSEAKEAVVDAFLAGDYTGVRGPRETVAPRGSKLKCGEEMTLEDDG